MGGCGVAWWWKSYTAARKAVGEEESGRGEAGRTGCSEGKKKSGGLRACG